MGVLFEGGGLYAIRKFYMGANSSRGGGGGGAYPRIYGNI